MKFCISRNFLIAPNTGLDPQRLLRGPIAKEILIPPMGRDITPTPTQMGVNTTTREMVEALSTRMKTRAMPGLYQFSSSWSMVIGGMGTNPRADNDASV